MLVVEYGDFADTENATVPYLATKDQSARLYDMPSVPQVGLAGRTANLRIGKAVGGSSAVNGMAWDRGSAPDYDGWEALGNPGWGWEGLAKYFRRSSSFSPPADEYVSRYGYEWTDDAYGDGPIQVGYPSWQWPEAGELFFSFYSGTDKVVGGLQLMQALLRTLRGCVDHRLGRFEPDRWR